MTSNRHILFPDFGVKFLRSHLKCVSSGNIYKISKMGKIANQKMISVVVPVYRSKESLDELNRRLTSTLEALDVAFEIIMINDGCPEGSWEIISSLSKKNSRIKGINLSRNFGQHVAISAGLDFAEGDWVVVMDCDLQDQPEEIPKMLAKAKEGYDVVVGLRLRRQDSVFKKLTSKWFYKVFSYLANTKIDNRIGNFGVYSKKVIESLRRFKEQNRSFPLFVLWMGFKRAEIGIEHAWRPHGLSSYSLSALSRLALDSTIAHSDKLLRINIKVGFFIAFFSMIYVLWLIAMKLIKPYVELGWTSVMVSIFFATGLIMTSVGVVGLYVSKIFDETKNRPLYLVQEKTFDLTHEDS